MKLETQRIKIKPMKRLALLFVLLHLINLLNAQTDSCKVLLKAIAGEYNGKCRNGLANGKGTAKGEDTYTGLFKNGFPDGKGTYIFKNGNNYKGYWKDGLKDGKGKFVYTVNGESQTMTGYWKNGDYIGKTDLDISYRVTSSSGIIHYEVEKVEDKNNYKDNVITISIKSAMTDFLPADLKINNSSGQLIQKGKKLVVSQYFCPLNCEISYSIITGGNQRKLCRFIVEITEKGKYEITLSND